MAAVAAGHDSQEAIAEAVGMTVYRLRPQLKDLVTEGILVEETGPHNRKIYRKLSHSVS